MTELISVLVKCSNCDTINDLDATRGALSFNAREDECGSCGSHGEVTLAPYADCRSCGKRLDDIEVSTW